MVSFCVISCNFLQRCEYEKYSKAFVIENDFYKPIIPTLIKSAACSLLNTRHNTPIPSSLRAYTYQ